MKVFFWNCGGKKTAALQVLDRLHLGEIHRQWRAGCYDTLGVANTRLLALHAQCCHKTTHTHSKVLTNFEDRLDFWQYRAHLWYHFTGVGYLLRLQCEYQNICAGKFLLAQIVFVLDWMSEKSARLLRKSRTRPTSGGGGGTMVARRMTLTS